MMKSLEALRRKESRLIIGLMSGTSADGVDAALCRVHGAGPGLRVELVAFVSRDFDAPLRERILAVASGQPCTTRDLTLLSACLGQLYASCCLAACEEARLAPEQIDLVASHGQTLWHAPMPEAYLGRMLTGTLQLGEPSYINEALGCPVVSDFRVRDMAAGGQGAPLVPYTEFLLYRRADAAVGLQNIGGIGNLTVLPPDCTLADVTAFDTGPGNMVIDALAARVTGGCLTYDEDGRLAARGTVSAPLLAWLLEDDYLRQPPPKSTGRERYGAAYVQRLLGQAARHALTDADLLATATRFTAECIRLGVEAAGCRPRRLIVGGGGSKNPTLMGMIAEALPDIEVLRQEDLGLSSQAKEAVAFAILGNEFLFANPGNVPSATGARHPVVLGKLSL